jgi:hypothetical protein
MFSAVQVALIGNASASIGGSREQVHLEDARMKVGDLREVHAVSPNSFKRRVDYGLLPGSQWRLRHDEGPLPFVGSAVNRR